MCPSLYDVQVNCFATKTELKDAITDCSSSTSSECEVIKNDYGWPMKEWCFYDTLTDMSSLFNGKSNFDEDISGWDVSRVTNMYAMFQGAAVFNHNIGGWDVSRVVDMKNLFHNAADFNQDLSEWDVSSVTDMVYMFQNANNFNQDISGWDTSSVTDMRHMFNNAAAFNQDLSAWDVSRVTFNAHMFDSATSFNQNLCSWRDNFPYNNADNTYWWYGFEAGPSAYIFKNSGCTYTQTPDQADKSPFCASDCGGSSNHDREMNKVNSLPVMSMNI